MPPSKKLSNHEGRLIIRLTTPTLAMQIAEVKDRLDAWLRSIEPPDLKSGQVQDLRLVGINPLTYELIYEKPDLPPTWAISLLKDWLELSIDEMAEEAALAIAMLELKLSGKEYLLHKVVAI